MNINDTIRVKLTAVGLAALKQQHDDLREVAPSLREWSPPITDGNGYSEMQLWCLMKDLGHLCIMGAPLPFETTILLASPRDPGGTK